MSVIYSIHHIFHQIDATLKQPKPTLKSMHAYWKALLRWVQGQLIFDRKILIPSFGFIITLTIQQTKVIGLQILTTFLNENKIRYRQEFQQFTKPIVSLHYAAIGKMLEKTEQPELLTKCLDRLFKIILDMLRQDNVTVDLGVLGKMIIHDKILIFQPFVTYKKKHEGRTTVSQLVVNKQNSFRIKAKMQQSCSEMDQSSIRPDKLNMNQSVLLQSSRFDGVPFSPTIGTQAKKYLKSDFTKYLDMLGEVSDPLGRGYNFSELSKVPGQLLATTFTKSDYCKPRYPPILDKSVQTLAAPMNNQQYNLSICGRIACNYNSTARSLYFDAQSRCIKKYVPVEGIKFKAQPTLLQTPATDFEQLLYLQQGRTEFAKKVSARRKCFERYNEYIEKQIPHALVTPIDRSQVRRILEKSGVDADVARDRNLTRIVDDTLVTIVKDYYYSGRKAILDYVLKDVQERERIGIVQILKPQANWGQPSAVPIKFSHYSKKYIKQSKHHIEQHLLLSKCALSVKENWRQYENQFLISLPGKSSATNLLYFVKKQQQKMAEVRVSLRGKWYESVVGLMKLEIKQMKSKERVTALYRSMNALMANLLRELVEKSMLKYLQFFEQYKKQRYRKVEELLEDESIIEHAFITVKLKDEGQNIIFAQNLNTHVKQELLDLLLQMIKQSKDFPCVSSKEFGLWEVPSDAQVYKYCYGKIEQIIDASIAEVERATLVYKKYEHLFYRQAQIAEWCNTKHSIQEYTNAISQTKSLFNKLLTELPFTIKMNMILVDGTDLKKKFISILTEVEHQLYQSIYQNIKNFYAQIKTKIEGMKAALKPKVDSTIKLLEIESEMYRIKKMQVPEIRQAFANLKRWINLLFGQGSPLLTQSDLMQVYLISRNIHGLGELISNQQQRVAIQKQEIEKNLKIESAAFSENIQALLRQLEEMVQQFTIRKQFSNYNKLIKQFTAKYLEATVTRETINSQEQHLGWIPSKFGQMEQISKALTPITQFWSIIAVVDVQLKQWRSQPVKNLMPEQIESVLEKNLSQLEKISQNQLGNYCLSYKAFTEVRNELIDMQQRYLPLVKIFANKGLKERHWEAFAKQFSICQNKQTLSLNKMISYKVADEYDKIDVLAEISEFATKEFNIQKAKTKMVEEWYPLALVLKQFNGTGIMVVGSQMQTLFDLLSQQLQKIIQLKQLEEARIFEQNLLEWQLWLKYVQSLFTEWMKVQNSWFYLYPIFADQQVAKNFPLEHSEFESISNSWKSIMRRVLQQPRIVELTKNKKMLDIFLENNMKLSVMQNTISTFLSERHTSS